MCVWGGGGSIYLCDKCSESALRVQFIRISIHARVLFRIVFLLFIYNPIFGMFSLGTSIKYLAS